MTTRRHMLTGLAAALGLAGLGTTALAPRAARAQTARSRPIAIAATSGGTRHIARVYAGASANELVLMVRSGGRESWRLLTLPRGAAEFLQARLAEGTIPATLEQGNRSVDLDARIRRQGANLAFSITGGRGRIEGIATAPPEPGPSTRLGLLGAIVAIFAIMAIVAIVGMLTGTPIRMRFRCRGVGCEADWQIGREEPGAPAGSPPPDGFMANPECDLLPPMLC